MNRKFTSICVLIVLALVTLACGLGGSEPEPTATSAPAPTKPPAAATEAPAPTEVPAPTEAPAPTEPPAESEDEYDTVFPLPDDVWEFMGEGGESGINFQTSLSIEESIEFYREALADMGLAEYDVLTSIQDDGFSLVFTGWSSGEELVLQGVDFGDSTNVNIRLEEIVEAEETTPPETASGEEYRSEMGGFAFQPIPDYTVEEVFGFASMEAPDADPDTGPALLLIGGENEEGSTTEELYDKFIADLETGIEVSEPDGITVAGLPGLVVDVSGMEGDKEMRGRVVFVAVPPAQSFSMIGMAPRDRWDDEFEPLFEDVLASVSFFEPELDLDLEEEIEGDEIRQWASSASASSEYDNPNWAAIQATGAPDTPDCGDYTTAWASAESDTVEWLELSYDTAVYPTEVNIVQSYNPNQVLFVDLLDTEGELHGIYVGEPEDMSDECPYTLSIPVEGADYLVVGVRITIDQSVLATWNEIDAVELVGIGE